MEEKQSKINCNIVIIILLMLMVLGLGGYIFYDKVILTDNNISKPNDIAEPNENSVLDNIGEPRELEIDSIEAKKLIDKITISNDSFIYYFTVNKILDYKCLCIVTDTMSLSEKFDFVYHKYKSLIIETNKDNKIFYSLEESKLKKEYENIFGPNTYTQIDKIRLHSLVDTDHKGGALIYNPDNKSYEIEKYEGFGGTALSINEKVLSAVKFLNKIELLVEYTNADNLMVKIQYTFKLNADGQYYYYSAKKI